MHRHQHITTPKYVMHCSQTVQFIANGQANIPRKYDECLIYLSLLLCQPVYLWDIYALQFFLVQKKGTKQDSQVVWGFRLPQMHQKIILYSWDAEANKCTSMTFYICNCGSLSVCFFASSSFPEHRVEIDQKRQPSFHQTERQKQRQRAKEKQLSFHTTGSVWEMLRAWFPWTVWLWAIYIEVWVKGSRRQRNMEVYVKMKPSQRWIEGVWRWSKYRMKYINR